MGGRALKNAFLQNRERYLSVSGDDLGFVPPTELSRKAGLGEIPNPFTGTNADRFAPYLAPSTQTTVPRLAAAYRDSGDEAHAEKAKSLYLGWIARHSALKPEQKLNNIDEVVHGLYGWLGTLHLLLASPAFDDETVESIINTARDQLAFLHDHVWAEHNWINLRNSYAASLLCNGLSLAFLPEAAQWIARGAHVMSDACHRQINPDGSHREATPHYHFCTAGDLLGAFRVARALPELKMNMCPEKMASLFDYLVAATHPSGWISSMHDGDYGASSGLRGNGVADILEERAAFRQSLDLPEAHLPTTHVFPDAGQAFLRDDWTSESTYLTFDATRFGGYHQHPSCNAIQLDAFGRRLLVDPGRLSYQARPWNVYGWSTRAHSTMNVNGWNQARGTPRLRHRSAPGYDLVEGLYSGGYWEHESRVDWDWENESAESIFGEHHRLLLWIRDRCVVVIDNMLCANQGGQSPSLECVWQLGEGPVTLAAEQGQACTGHPDANLLMLFPLQPDDTTLTVHEGETDPHRGWVPHKFDEEYTPAPQVVQSSPTFAPNGHVDLAAVLIPYPGTEPPQVEAIALADPEKTTSDFFHPGYGRVQLRWADGSTDDIWWKRRLATALDEQEGFMTDGSLVHLQKNADGELEKGLVVDGTFIAPYAAERRRHAETFRYQRPAE